MYTYAHTRVPTPTHTPTHTHLKRRWVEAEVILQITAVHACFEAFYVASHIRLGLQEVTYDASERACVGASVRECVRACACVRTAIRMRHVRTRTCLHTVVKSNLE